MGLLYSEMVVLFWLLVFGVILFLYADINDFRYQLLFMIYGVIVAMCTIAFAAYRDETELRNK